MLNFAGRGNGRASIWRRRIRSIFVCLLNENQENNDQVNDFKFKRNVDTISIRGKVAVNHFHLFRSFDGKESAQFMSHSLQIKTWRWHLSNVKNFTRPICLSFNLFYSSLIQKFLLILPFNILVKSATADFVPLNSVIVEAKFLVAVSNWFECAEPFHLNLKFIEQFLILN